MAGGVVTTHNCSEVVTAGVHSAYLIVTGVKRSIVVTLSKKAERTAAMRHSMMIMAHTRPRESRYAWVYTHGKEQARVRAFPEEILLLISDSTE